MSFDFRTLSKEEMLRNAEVGMQLYHNSTGCMEQRMNVRVVDCVPMEGLTILEYTIPPEFKNTNGQCHGGGIAVIADSAMSLGACACGDGGPNPTIDMTVNYIRPFRLGEVVTCKSYTSHVGRSMSRVTLRMYVGEELRAEATGNYARNNKK